ncbi:MAG: hypothetical protein FJ303_00235 [Planctomycetes bacterium]|nr:hypothetical protein [Planctomycetota bacterium]
MSVRQKREGRYHGRVLGQHGESLKSVHGNRAVPKVFERLRDGVFANADIDSGFPVACGADPLLVGRVDDRRSSLGAQLGIGQVEPQDRVRVEQQHHGMYSAKSCKWSSSSEMIVNIPLPRPSIGRGVSRGMAISFATGLPFCVRTISSLSDNLS